MEESHIVLYIAVFLIVFVPYIIIQNFMGEKRTARRKFEDSEIPSLYAKTYWLLSSFAESAGKLMQTLRPDFTKKISQKLEIANIKLDVSYVMTAQLFFCMSATIASVLFSIGMGLDSLWLVVIPSLCAFIGWIYPAMIIEKAAEERQTSITKSLPFAIDLIGSAMRAGLDFSAAMRYYVSISDKKSPLTVEFNVVLRQMELGKTRIEALEDMAKRIQIKEFTSFAAAVIHGTEVGASIVDTMQIQGEEMRRARFAIAERKAARAPSLMILPIALFIMPAFFVIIGAPILIRMQESGASSVF